MSSRSNSAKAAKIPNEFAGGGGGVDGRALARQNLQPDAALGQVVDDVDQVPRVPPNPSSFQTTRVSSWSRRALRQAASSGRSSFFPATRSSYSDFGAMPAARRASRCRSESGVVGEVQRAFMSLWLYWCMDADDHAADPGAGWESLQPGQEVEVREPGRADRAGVIDDLTPDGSVVWVRLHGQSPRRMFLEGDPVVILPEVPGAF
jgi:hypothetical protein